MSAEDLDAVLERIARLWTEMQGTRTRDPKHAKLMAEIHDQSAIYLRLVDLQRGLSKVDRADKTGKPEKPDKAARVDKPERADRAESADKASRRQE
jgi:hypothetical protein